MYPSVLGWSETFNLKSNQRDQLCDLLGSAKLTLLYKASIHGYQNSNFHRRCDNQGATLLVAFNHSGNVFGGYTSVSYANRRTKVDDKDAFLFTFKGKTLAYIKVNKGCFARYDDDGAPSFGEQLYFCYNNNAIVYSKSGNSFSFTNESLFGEDRQLRQCEVYRVEQTFQTKNRPWRNFAWRSEQRDKLMQLTRDYTPSIWPFSKVRILMIGPVGAGKSSFFNSVNSVFTGHVTNKAMCGSASTSLTTRFRVYPVKDGREGKPLPFVLCDTMGLEEQSGAGLDLEDVSSILHGSIPDRYKFYPGNPFEATKEKPSRASSLQEKIHCVVYVIDSNKISIMSEKVEEKLATIRRELNLLDIPQMVLMTKVDEACPQVEENLKQIYFSPYIKTKVQEVSARLGVPVSCVLPVKNYSQELELELDCDILLLSALQQMLRLADDYLDDIAS